MKPLEYNVRFNTPAFLGNVNQQAQWRTPPFKALLRQWWRVAMGNTNIIKLREEEGQLFGAASDDGGGSQKSQVRIRLDSWTGGKLQGTWGNDPPVRHEEVGPQGRNIGSHLYLGYGPLEVKKGTTSLKFNAAIQAGETNKWKLIWPDNISTIADALQLIHWFGTLGGRSRNGWGSLELEECNENMSMVNLEGNHPLLQRVVSPLRNCLQNDWPHALGTSIDGIPLIWQSTQTFTTWREAMQALAKAKIGFRIQFPLGARGPFEQRHLLSYPVTNHTVNVWGNQARLANQIRFKVVKNSKNQLIARIFHLPCGLPEEMIRALADKAPNIQQQEVIWQKVHSWLDNTQISGFRRMGI